MLSSVDPHSRMVSRPVGRSRAVSSLLLIPFIAAGCSGEASDAGSSPPFVQPVNGAVAPPPGAVVLPQAGVVVSPEGVVSPGPVTQPESSEPSAAPVVPVASPQAAAPLPWPRHTDGVSSSIRRLSRNEIASSLEVLTGSAVDASTLPAERRSGPGLLRTTGISLVGAEVSKMELFMREFAERAAPTVLTATGCSEVGAAQQACLQGWAMDFASRAQRRAVDARDSEFFQQLLSIADGTEAADRVAVADILYSNFITPSFTYRTQAGTPAEGRSSVRELMPQELAARLSFFANQAPPDKELIEAAELGLLTDPAQRLAHFERLRSSPLGEKAVSDFFFEWLSASDSKVAAKGPTYLEALPDGFNEDIVNSARGAIRDVVNGEDPSIQHLFTTTGYLDDPSVQAITRENEIDGVKVGDNEQTGRSGLMMHPYLISSLTGETGLSPFQIGVHLKESILCEHVPGPPADAVEQVKENSPDDLSFTAELRFRTDAGPACSACHAVFNELGFTHSPFDPHGRWVQEDPTGQDWQLSGSVPTFGGDTWTFDSASDVNAQFAVDPQVRGCFAQAAIESAFGRALVADDEAFAARVNAVAQAGRGDIKETFRAIVAAPEFVFTNAPEIAQ